MDVKGAIMNTGDVSDYLERDWTTGDAFPTDSGQYVVKEVVRDKAGDTLIRTLAE